MWHCCGKAPNSGITDGKYIYVIYIMLETKGTAHDSPKVREVVLDTRWHCNCLAVMETA